MSDLISRQAAIDAINALDEMPNAWLDYAVDAVLALPSVEPERKKGKWNKIHWKAFKCSKCHKVSEYCTDFCPNCGAKMDEVERNDNNTECE